LIDHPILQPPQIPRERVLPPRQPWLRRQSGLRTRAARSHCQLQCRIGAQL